MERREIEHAVVADGQRGDGLGGEAMAPQHGGMFRGHDEQAVEAHPTLAGEIGGEGERSGFRRTRGEDDAFRVRADQRRHAGARRFDEGAGAAAFGMDRGRVDGPVECRQGGGPGFGTQRCRGVVVEIDALADGLAGHGWFTQKSCNRKGQAC